MTKLTLTTHPLMLGFDKLERLVADLGKAETGGYPPFNIEQTAPNAALPPVGTGPHRRRLGAPPG